MVKLKLVKTIENTPPLERANPTDSGFDIYAMKEVKRIGDVILYDSGWKAQFDTPGWYLHLYPRSSISKTGYSLANSVGIIDEGYTGSILIALRKHGDGPDLELPCKIAQLVPMKRFEYVETELVDELEDTERGEGGFGSTDKFVPMARFEAENLVNNYVIMIDGYKGVTPENVEVILGKRAKLLFDDPVRQHGVNGTVYPWNVVDYLVQEFPGGKK